MTGELKFEEFAPAGDDFFSATFKGVGVLSFGHLEEASEAKSHRSGFVVFDFDERFYEEISS